MSAADPIRSHTKKPGEPRCARPKCRNAVSARDFCHGCGAYVCREHTSTLAIDVPHEPAAHWTEFD